MTWDWKKAIGTAGECTGAALGSGSRCKHSSAGNKDQLRPGGTLRTASIAWRTSGGYGSAIGGEVELIHKCEHQCPFCHGRGEVSGGSICPVCNGRKTVHVEGPSVKCAFCGGLAHMPPRSNLTCWVCNGKGLVPVTAPVQVCPDCLGRGKRPCQSLYCPRCRGVGVVSWTGIR